MNSRGLCAESAGETRLQSVAPIRMTIGKPASSSAWSNHRTITRRCWFEGPAVERLIQRKRFIRRRRGNRAQRVMESWNQIGASFEVNDDSSGA